MVPDEDEVRRHAVLDLLRRLVDTDEGRVAVAELLRASHDSNGSQPGTPGRTMTPFRDGNSSVTSVLGLPGARPIDIDFIQTLGTGRRIGLSPGESTGVKISSLVLVVKVAEPPRSMERPGLCSVTVRDGDGNTLKVVMEHKRSEIQGRDFMTYVRSRFVPGTTIALRNIILVINNDGFVVMMDMADDDSEVYFCGDDALPSTQSTQPPFRDGNSSVRSVLRLPEASPIDIGVIQLLGSTRGVGLSPGESTGVKISNLVLVVKVAEPPRSMERPGMCAVTVKDGDGNTLKVIMEHKLSEIQGRDFMTYVRSRFVPGTTIALRNIIMLIRNDGFVVTMDMADNDSEVYFCGDDALPSTEDILG